MAVVQQRNTSWMLFQSKNLRLSHRMLGCRSSLLKLIDTPSCERPLLTALTPVASSFSALCVWHRAAVKVCIL